MRATILHATRDIRLEQVPDPTILRPTDALVRVTATCVCGSDLWPYRGINEVTEPRAIGHEFVGIVDEIGPDVSTVTVGDFVIAPFYDCDNTCVNCVNGVSTSCLNGGWWGANDRLGGFADGAQGERERRGGDGRGVPPQRARDVLVGDAVGDLAEGRAGKGRHGGRPSNRD